MGRMVKRLTNLEIDEISLVDRPANQYGTVEITKAYQEDTMTVFDAQGSEVFEEELEPGDFVYNEAGDEFVVADEGGEEDGADELDYELESVGKAGRGAQTVARRTMHGAAMGHARAAGDNAGGLARYHAGNAKDAITSGAQRANRGARRRLGGDRATAFASSQARGAQSAFAADQGRGAKAYDRARTAVAGDYGKNPYKYVGGGAALVGTGGVMGTRKKSLGDSVLEELSKALTDGDRDEVIAKAMDQMGAIADRNADLEQAVQALYDNREFEGFHDVAKGYGFGDEDEVAGILFRASQVLPQEDVAALDRYFTGAGEIAKSYMNEIGYGGGYEDSDTMGQIMELAGQAVAKNAELGLTQEQAVTAMFTANPDSYDMYEAERRQR